jgi:phosphoribosylformimino-5-aminoimidazole carboxamide ribotide isomerase
VLYTDVARDGMGSGPNVAATAALAERSPFPIIASGGVGTEAHLSALAAVPNVESAIVGRALYDGSLTVEQALAAASAG